VVVMPDDKCYLKEHGLNLPQRPANELRLMSRSQLFTGAAEETLFFLKLWCP